LERGGYCPPWRLLRRRHVRYLLITREGLHRKAVELNFFEPPPTQPSHEIRSLGSLRRPEAFTQKGRGLIFVKPPVLGSPPLKTQSVSQLRGPEGIAYLRMFCWGTRRHWLVDDTGISQVGTVRQAVAPSPEFIEIVPQGNRDADLTADTMSFRKCARRRTGSASYWSAGRPMISGQTFA
jgi:hypothetical protein